MEFILVRKADQVLPHLIFQEQMEIGEDQTLVLELLVVPLLVEVAEPEQLTEFLRSLELHLAEVEEVEVDLPGIQQVQQVEQEELLYGID